MKKNTWAAVAKKAGVNPNFIPDVSGYPEALKKRAIADYKIGIIAMALNPADWKPDYANDNQYKYYPYFLYNESVSAFRFNYSGCDDTGAGAGTGVRHVFATRELSDAAGKDFIDIYNDQLL